MPKMHDSVDIFKKIQRRHFLVGTKIIVDKSKYKLVSYYNYNNYWNRYFDFMDHVGNYPSLSSINDKGNEDLTVDFSNKYKNKTITKCVHCEIIR